MKIKLIKSDIFVLCFLVFGGFLMFYCDYQITKQEKERCHDAMKTYNKMIFSGKILSIYQLNRYGKPNGIICIQLDTTNITDFYKFGEYGLKIKNGIATMPIGTSTSFMTTDVKYVSVNRNYNKKMLYYDSCGTFLFDWNLTYYTGYFKEKDFNLCDTCQPLAGGVFVKEMK